MNYKNKKLIFVAIPILLLIISLVSNFFYPPYFILRILSNYSLLIYFSVLVSIKIYNLITKKDKLIIEIKTILKLIPIVLLIIIISLYMADPFFNNWTFYLKHILVYILLAYLIVMASIIIFNKITRENNITKNKINILKVATLGMIIISLSLLSTLQMKYINTYEIPPLYGCSYYDEFDNLIYDSQFEGTCPTIYNLSKKVNNDTTELSFQVQETAYGKNNIKAVIDSDIKYIYDALNRVIYYEITNYVHYTEWEETPYGTSYFKKVVENEYDENKVISTNTVYVPLHFILDKNEDVESIEPTVVEYTSERNNETNEIIISERDITEDPETIHNLYTIALINADEESYAMVIENKNNDIIVIEYDKRLSYNLKKKYSSLSFGTSHEVLFECYQYTNDSFFSYYSRENGWNNFREYEMQQNEGSLLISNEGNTKYKSILIETDFGKKITHYSYRRDNLDRFEDYKYVVSDFQEKNNMLSTGLRYINDYSFSIQSPYQRSNKYIYQKNPLLFEHELLSDGK